MRDFDLGLRSGAGNPLTLYGCCQHFNVIGEHSLARRLSFGVRMNYGIRTQLRRRVADARLGESSRFAEGQWVQVLDRDAVARTLDAGSRLRGLKFLQYQWDFCGGAYRVQKVMRRIIDDAGIFRPVSRTLLLEGVHCGGVTGAEGCGRQCPIMFRDEWLKPAASPLHAPDATLAARGHATVKPVGEIIASLDRRGKRDGLQFTAEMQQWCGRRLRIAHKVGPVWECGTHTRTTRPFYVLEGLHCSGSVLGTRAPCDRHCSILWHGDWLVLEQADG